MTTLLAPDEIGKMTLALTTIAFFALFLVNPLGMFINRRLHGWRASGVLKRYLHAYGAYLVGVAVVASGAVAVAMHFGLLGIGMPIATVAVLVAGSLVFNTINQTLIPSLNLLGRVGPFVALTLGTLLTSLGLAILCVKIGGPRAQLWLAGTVAGQALLGGIAYALFFEAGPADTTQRPTRRKRLRNLLAFCWPAAIAVGLGWAQMQGYRFIIASEGGLTELGLFTAGYGIAAAMLAALEQILTTWFQPRFYRDANSDAAQVHAAAWQSYARVVLPLSTLGLFAVIAAAPDLVALMLGPAFQGVAPFVMLGALAESTRVWVGVFVLIAHLRLKTRLLIVPSALGAALTLSLIFVFMPRYGLYIAPLSVAAGSLAACAWLHRSGRSHEYKTDLPWLHITLAGGAGAAMLALVGGLRPALQGLGWLAHPAGLASIALLFAPLGWYCLGPARRQP